MSSSLSFYDMGSFIHLIQIWAQMVCDQPRTRIRERDVDKRYRAIPEAITEICKIPSLSEAGIK